jgi:arsenate reductase
MSNNSLLTEAIQTTAPAIFKALADPNRLKILDLLMQGESCNYELTEWLGITPSLLSHHLRTLREAGLVVSRRDAIDGRWVYYAVDREVIFFWRQWFNEMFDLARIQPRSSGCGPENQLSEVKPGEAQHRVLFLCTGNSARSQMAEAIVNTRLIGRWQAVSAGTHPADRVHPLAVAALDELGIDWQDHQTKTADQFQDEPFDLVVTLCNNARREVPDWVESSVHVGFPDPVQARGGETEIRQVFRQVRNDIAAQIPTFLTKWAKMKI